MVKKKENLLVVGMYCLIVAFLFKSFANASLILDLIVLIFLGISILAAGRYVILSSQDKKKK